MPDVITTMRAAYQTRLEHYIPLIGATKRGPRDYWQALCDMNEETGLGLSQDKLAVKCLVAGGLDAIQRFGGIPFIADKYRGNSGEHPIFAALLAHQVFLASGLADHPDVAVRAHALQEHRATLRGILIHDDGESFYEFGTVSDDATKRHGKDNTLTEHRVQRFVYQFAAHALQQARTRQGGGENEVTPALLGEAAKHYDNMIRFPQHYFRKQIETRRDLVAELDRLPEDSPYRAIVQEKFDAMDIPGETHAILDHFAENHALPLNPHWQKITDDWNEDYQQAEGLTYAHTTPSFADPYENWAAAGLKKVKTFFHRMVRLLERCEGNFHYEQLMNRGNAIPYHLAPSHEMLGTISYVEGALIDVRTADASNPAGSEAEKVWREKMTRFSAGFAYEQLTQMSLLGPPTLNRKASGADEGPITEAARRGARARHIGTMRTDLTAYQNSENDVPLSRIQFSAIPQRDQVALYHKAATSGHMPAPGSTPLIMQDILPPALALDYAAKHAAGQLMQEYAKNNPHNSPYQGFGRANVYVAGPWVFEPNAKEIGTARRQLLRKAGLQAFLPIDNEPPAESTPERQAQFIYNSNMDMMENSDIIIADFTPFRGASVDSGTAGEILRMAGEGKIVVGYSEETLPYAQRVLHHLGFEDKKGHIARALAEAPAHQRAAAMDRALTALAEEYPDAGLRKQDGRWFAPDNMAIENFGLPDNLMLACAAQSHGQLIAKSFEEAVDIARQLWERQQRLARQTSQALAA